MTTIAESIREIKQHAETVEKFNRNPFPKEIAHILAQIGSGSCTIGDDVLLSLAVRYAEYVFLDGLLSAIGRHLVNHSHPSHIDMARLGRLLKVASSTTALRDNSDESTVVTLLCEISDSSLVYEVDNDVGTSQLRDVYLRASRIDHNGAVAMMIATRRTMPCPSLEEIIGEELAVPSAISMIILPRQYATYAAYLNSEQWQATRRAALERAHYQCQVCAGKEHLQVHHNSYANLGNEQAYELVVLCDECHRIFHENRRI